jgi:hypothetical protein
VEVRVRFGAYTRPRKTAGSSVLSPGPRGSCPPDTARDTGQHLGNTTGSPRSPMSVHGPDAGRRSPVAGPRGATVVSGRSASCPRSMRARSTRCRQRPTGIGLAVRGRATSRRSTACEEERDGGIRRCARMEDQGNNACSRCRLNVIVRIRLVPGAGITAAQLQAAENTWEPAIQQAWSGQFPIRLSNGRCACERYSVRLDVQWVTSGEHHVVQVHAGSGRADRAAGDCARARWGRDRPLSQFHWAKSAPPPSPSRLHPAQAPMRHGRPS